jgi:hypothetical protein
VGRVLTGAAAREWIKQNDPGKEYWAAAVAVCECGWGEATIHGEFAELLLVRHGATATE